MVPSPGRASRATLVHPRAGFARNESIGRTLADRRSLLILSFLGVVSVAVVASLIFVGLRALRLWRAFWAFSRTATTAFDRVTRAAAKAEEHSASLTENQARLMRATERLQISLTQLALLRAAAAEARAAVDRVRGVVPTK